MATLHMNENKPVERFDDTSIKLLDMTLSDERIAILVAIEMEQRIKEDEGKNSARDLAPIVSRKDIGNGITETVRIHYGWAAHYRFLSVHKQLDSIFGKYHYIWKKDEEEVSCVKLMPPWYNEYPWETCHPERRYKTVGEARSYIKQYFKRKERAKKKNDA